MRYTRYTCTRCKNTLYHRIYNSVVIIVSAVPGVVSTVLYRRMSDDLVKAGK